MYEFNVQREGSCRTFGLWRNCWMQSGSALQVCLRKKIQPKRKWQRQKKNILFPLFQLFPHTLKLLVGKA